MHIPVLVLFWDRLKKMLSVVDGTNKVGIILHCWFSLCIVVDLVSVSVGLSCLSSRVGLPL